MIFHRNHGKSFLSKEIRRKENKEAESQRTKEEDGEYMGDLFAWLISFFLLIAILGTILYQLMCLADLEYDYINPYDSASRINSAILPEFIAQGAFCFLQLVSGHWIMLFLCLPYTYYNVKLYTERKHVVDVTEIFNQLAWEKKLRLFKLGYLILLLALSIVWLILSVVDE